MTRLILTLLLLLYPISARAQTARVISGEHADFTRLVIELPTGADWRLGRTDSGYALAVTGATQPRYDLTGVWDRIPRTRLKALWANPEDGMLTLDLACACHAFPFEFRPGMVVIDLREGPAPKGSAFELALDGSTKPALVASPVSRPEAPPKDAATNTAPAYDWLEEVAPPTVVRKGNPGLPVPLPTGLVSLDPLRDALLAELSRSAAAGMIEMTLPPRQSGATENTAEVSAEALPWSRIVIGEVPGVAAGSELQGKDSMLADGSACIPDASLSVASWGNDQLVALQIADARAGLIGEFDVPDKVAMKRTVRQHLFLGFGAEALQYLALIEAPSQDVDLQLYAGLARIIDGIADPSSPFRGMLTCDTSAALWSALLYAQLPTGSGVNVPAILRGFAALPPHLRQYLGPKLAERFLARGDVDAARMVRDATARVPGIPAGATDLLDAQLGLGEGRTGDAALSAQAALDGGGAVGMEAAPALVEANFRKMEPIGPELLTTVTSYLAEAVGTDKELVLRRAHVLALALAGQPAEALLALDQAPETEADLWQVIAARATDEQLLTVAVLAPGTPRPQAADATVLAMAGRLADLGFADAALVWLGAIAADADPEVRLLAARAELARGDARAARALVSDLKSPDALEIYAKALTRLGEISPAGEAWRSAGFADEALRLSIWERDWTAVSLGAVGPWKDAALLAVSAETATPPPDGLLAQGAALVDASAEARKRITDLLGSVVDPTSVP